ncbi:MAG: glycerol kinase GlpK [Lachnospiraceae bacterium]|nr:glycerol kinase GlpK [Lachnospiraceae bacterium]
MGNYILGIDQSTTTTKAIIFDKKARVVARSDVNHAQIHPNSDWVEHDPEEIWRNLLTAVRNVVEKAGIGKEEIACICVTNQRETTMLWTEEGKPAYNALVWQDIRAENIVCRDEIAKERDYITSVTGLQLSAYFSAAKAAWIKEHCESATELYFGTMDSWVLYKLTGRHVTDYSNASRTQLFNIMDLKWDEKIIRLFGLEQVHFPEVLFSDEIYGETTLEGYFDHPIPVAGDMGDSHGALFAQQCWNKGMGKCTFGTGGSIMMNIGEKPVRSKNRLNTSIAWGMDHVVEYVFEGTIINMGNTVSWMKNDMHFIESSAQSQELAESVDSTEGVYLIPAFNGLGAPYWDSDARGIICGLLSTSTVQHVVRAGLEAIAYQIKDIITPMMRDACLELEELRVDGGPTNNGFLMQFTADILGTRLLKNDVEELSALGAAYAGGLATGFWKDREEISGLRSASDIYERRMDEKEAEKLYAGWRKYVETLIKGH